MKADTMENKSRWQSKELTEIFLNGVRGAIPGADLQLAAIGKITDRWCPAPRRILDLGCGNGILGHILGSKDASRNVAAHAAQASGVDASIIKKMLPVVAAMAMGALSKQTDSGRRLKDDGGGLLGSLLDSNQDGQVLDDVINLARKLF